MGIYKIWSCKCQNLSCTCQSQHYLTRPGRQFQQRLNTGNLGSRATAGLSQPGLLRHSSFPGSTYCSNLAVWAAAPLQPGRSCSSLQSKFKFKKCRGYKYETLPQHVNWQPGARPRQVPVIWPVIDLGLAASLTWSFRLGVTGIFLALQQNGDALCGQSTGARR